MWVIKLTCLILGASSKGAAYPCMLTCYYSLTCWLCVSTALVTFAAKPLIDFQ